jgi:hypothetical protein
MAIEVKDGKFVYWVKGDGMKIPESLISEDDKLQDEIVTKHVKRAEEIRTMMEEFKNEVMQDSEALLELVAEKFKEKEWQGNATIYDFSKQMGIVIKNHKRKDFGAAVNMAVKKIDQWIDRAADRGEGLDLINIVRKLTKVDEGGKYDKDNLKLLLGLDVSQETELWQEAMKIIRDSEEVISTKTYFQFLIRSQERENRFDKISLDFADC